MGLFAKYKVTLGFKSGRTVKFKCDTYSVEQNGGEFTRYSFDKIRGRAVKGGGFFVSLSATEFIKIEQLTS